MAILKAKSFSLFQNDMALNKSTSYVNQQGYKLIYTLKHWKTKHIFSN